MFVSFLFSVSLFIVYYFQLHFHSFNSLLCKNNVLFKAVNWFIKKSLCMTPLSFCPRILCHYIALQLSDVWWISVRCMVKNECQRVKYFQRWNKCILKKKSSKIMIKIFPIYIVTEIKWFLKCLVWKGMNCIMYKLKFWAIFLLVMSNIASIQGPARVLLPRVYKIRY